MKTKPQPSIKIPKSILIAAKVLETISEKMTVDFAVKLFITPIKYKTPKREIEMDEKSIQKLILIPAINKEIMVYEYGKSDKKVLLVHGWSGRGTQLITIANTLLELGYSTISYDAPAHGKSPGKTSNMKEFIAANLELEKIYGPFDYAIGHSLGGMAVLNAVKQGLKVKKAVVIGSGDIIDDIITDFISNLKLKSGIADKMKIKLEKRFGETMNKFSAYIAAREITIPVLVMHDEDDDDVSVKAAHHIHENLKQAEIMITQGLGHRKILGDRKIIEKMVSFIKN